MHRAGLGGEVGLVNDLGVGGWGSEEFVEVGEGDVDYRERVVGNERW